MSRYDATQGYIFSSKYAVDPRFSPGIMDASTYVLILVTPINIALNVYFVHHTDLGLYGSPIALACTFSFAFFFLILYTAYSPTHTRNQTWGGLQLRTVLDARSCIAFLNLAFPGILMFGSEWCVLAFVTAVTPHNALSPNSFPLPLLPTYSGDIGTHAIVIRSLLRSGSPSKSSR